MIHRRRSSPRSSVWANHWLGLFALGVIVATIGGLQLTRAEFEAPLVDTTNFTNSDLYSVYGYFRSSRYANSAAVDDVTGTNPEEYYEAWAVGKNLDATSADKGVIFRFDGNAWERVSGGSLNVDQALNAVAGQYNPTTGTSEIFMVGNSGKILDTTNIHTAANSPSSIPSDITAVAAACGTNDYYAVAADSGAGMPVVIGGENGSLAVRLGATWTPRCATVIPAAEHITAIAVAPNNSVWYITTVSGVADAGAPGISLDDIRACGGSVVSKLYSYNPVTNALTTLVTTSAGGPCYFSLAVQARTASDGTELFEVNNGRSLNTIWVGASNGVFKFTETSGTVVTGSTVTPQGGTNTSKVFGLASNVTQGGDAQQLLFNGDFEAWDVSNPLSAADPRLINPSGWRTTEGIGKNNATGTCGANTADVVPISKTVPGGALAIKVQPGIDYPTMGDCLANGNAQSNFVSGAYQHIDLTNIDASKFIISGEYRVDPTGAPGATILQGGVAVACSGETLGNNLSNPQLTTPDCSFNTRQEITSTTAGVFKNFSIIVSNQNGQYNAKIPGISGQLKTTGGGMGLDIICEGTYGTLVQCDNLRVEAVTEPGAAGYRRIQVTAVGSNLAGTAGSVLRAPVGAGFAVEGVPSTPGATGVPVLYGTTSAQAEYVYAVGASANVFQRGPSNISGYFWNGTAGPATGGGKAGVGWISASCANVPASGRALCQRQPASYGLALENTGAQITLTGRAWIGKNYQNAGGNTDSETVNLGSCQNEAPGPNVVLATAPYNMTGACNTGTRTCYNSSKTCLRDFDCYGRCANDSGFACLYDGDCQIGATNSAGASPSPSGSNFAVLPQYRIQCDANNPSGNACASQGWLSFSATDIGIPPPAGIQATSVPPNDRNYCGAATPACLDSANCPDNKYGPCVDGPDADALPDQCSGNSAIACTTANEATACGQPCRLKGYGRILTLGNLNDPNVATDTDQGWVSLRGGVGTLTKVTINSIDRIFACKDCNGSKGAMSCAFCFDGAGNTCQPSAQPSVSLCSYFCDGDPTKATCKGDADCAAVSPTSSCKPVARCSRNATKTCASDSDCGSGEGYCASGALCSSSGATCQQYGVNYDPSTQVFNGYAWSSDLGWMDYRFARKGTGRFIRTRLGDVYSQRRVGDLSTTLAPGNSCNATYVISAGQTISNFCSSFSTGITDYSSLQPGAPVIPLGSSTNLFSTSLGRFDEPGIEAASNHGTCLNGSPKYCQIGQALTCTGDTQCSGLDTDSNYNKYGNFRIHLLPFASGGYSDISNSLTALTGSAAMGSTVMIAGDSTTLNNWFLINQPLAFVNGSSGGSGILIVNGNLRINKNFAYTSGAITDLRQLASLIVVVKGNLVIDASVTNLVGSFYVQGTVCTTPYNLYKNNPPTECSIGANPPGSNVGDNNSDGTINNKFALTVRGLMIAKKFAFGRLFAGTTDNPSPSEIFIYDGRLQSNPQPGTFDFVNSLPSSVSLSP